MGSVAGKLALEKGEGWHVRSRGYGLWVSVSAVAMSVSAWHPRLPPVGAEACTPEQVEEGSSPASSMGWAFSAVEESAVAASAVEAQAYQAMAWPSPLVRRTQFDLAAVAARSDEALSVGAPHHKLQS